MESTWECIIAGGPEHGHVCQLHWDAPGRYPKAIVSVDGQVCTPAARRNGGNRFIFLHPHATGAQFLTLLLA
jgi:hypothetical protein